VTVLPYETAAPATPTTGAAPDLTVIVRDHRPAPQGSKRHVGRGRLIEQSKRVTPWRVAVDTAAKQAMNARWLAGDGEEELSGPLSVEVAFTVRKPASAPKRRVTWPITRDSGDIDKLLRSTLDALTTSGAIADDSMVVEVIARKMHPGEGLDALDAPGAVIRIWRLTEGVPR
jgi:Holliday junction resolvase RusA-like endonuclease